MTELLPISNIQDVPDLPEDQRITLAKVALSDISPEVQQNVMQQARGGAAARRGDFRQVMDDNRLELLHSLVGFRLPRHRRHRFCHWGIPANAMLTVFTTAARFLAGPPNRIFRSGLSEYLYEASDNLRSFMEGEALGSLVLAAQELSVSVGVTSASYKGSSAS